MAADDAGERTEEPTQKRRQEAREKGQVPRSQDLTAATSLIIGLMLLAAFGPGVLDAFLLLVQHIGQAGDLRTGTLSETLRHCAVIAGWALLPLLLLMMVLSGVLGMLQSGFAISAKRLQPKLDKLNPANGVKKLFSTENLVKALMGLLKMAFVALVAWWTLVGLIQPVLSTGGLTPRGVTDVSLHVSFTLALRVGLALLLLALIDYFYQRWQVEKNLKMTKQEVKDEMKNMDGDPQLKQRRRQAQARIAMQRVSTDVPKADVVVTNPTEYAVALRYDEQRDPAPRVVAKGVDLVAGRIRQVAQMHGVPIVQRPPLARGLYADVEVGQEVPEKFFRAVAEVLAYVYQLSGKAAEAG